MEKKDIQENVVVTVFNVESEGFQALTEVKQSALGETHLVTAAALLKKENGVCRCLDGFDTGVHTTNDAAIGGLVGMLVGVLAGPVGMLLGASYGTLVGMNVDAADAVFGASMIEQIAEKLDDGTVALVALAGEETDEALDNIFSKFDTITARFDAEVIAKEVDEACEMQEEMARQARMQLRKEKEAEFDAALEETGEAISDSVKQGAANFLDDMARLKASVEGISADNKEKKAEKKSARREKFDSAVSEWRESFEKGAEKSEQDSAALLDSLKGIAEDAGIDVEKNSAVSDAFKALKESFEQGFEAMKSDAAFTKSAIDEISDDRKAEKQAKKAARSKKVDEAIAAMRESLE